MKKVSEIIAHEGPVWKLEWSHPCYNSLLATCGFDKKAIIWREINNSYEKVFEYIEHKNSISCISFGNDRQNLIFACGSSDGTISFHQYINTTFYSNKLEAHDFGVNSLSFNFNNPLRLVSCGIDSLIKIWTLNEDNTWKEDQLENNDEIAKDVAFRPKWSNDSFASCSEEGIVSYWEHKEDKWERRDLKQVSTSLSKLSWNDNGTILAVISSDGSQLVINEEELNQSAQ